MNDDGSDWMGALGEGLEQGGVALDSLEDRKEIERLIRENGIAPEDAEDFANAYYNEKHPVKTGLGLYVRSKRSMDEIINDTRERKERESVREAQQTLARPGADVFENDYAKRKPGRSLLDYLPRK